MFDIDKRAKKGLIIFAACAVLIILTGIVFKACNYDAAGPAGRARFNSGSFKTLDGYQIIWVGVIMLMLELLMLPAFLKKKKE
jgi:hypothetical protein